MAVHDGGEPLFLLALARAEFLRPGEKLALIEMLGSAERVLSQSLPDLRQLLHRTFRTESWDPPALLEAARRDRGRLEAGGIGCVFHGSPAYPAQLAEIHDPPLALFYRGRLPAFDGPMAAVVGTRRPTGAARQAAFGLGLELSLSGIPVVSGLALGIDGAAHEGSLEGRGCPVAVLGNGIDSIGPGASRRIGRRILEKGGAVFSEYPPGVPPLAYHFPARNRIIAGLCRSVVVVQAPKKSGALITAEYALEQGRDLYVHAAGLAGEEGAGTRGLAEAGAPVVARGREILLDWGMEGSARGVEAGAEGSDAWEPVAGRMDMEPGAALASLLRKEIAGECVERHGRIYWRG
jgi:DNA processing protein